MKSIIWTIGAFCAAATGWIVLGTRRVEPIQELAHKLEEAWQDHHTVV